MEDTTKQVSLFKSLNKGMDIYIVTMLHVGQGRQWFLLYFEDLDFIVCRIGKYLNYQK